MHMKGLILCSVGKCDTNMQYRNVTTVIMKSQHFSFLYVLVPLLATLQVFPSICHSADANTKTHS